MFLTIYIVITILAMLLFSGLYIVVTISRPQTELRRIFRWYLLAMFIWSLVAFLLYVDQNRAAFWFRMIVSAGLVTMVSVFRFSRSNINVRNRWDIAVLIYAVILIPFSLITDLIVKSVSVEGGVIVYELGNWIGLIAGPGYVLMLYSIGVMIRTYRKTIDPIQQNRLLYLILGTGIMILGSGLNFTPLGQYPLDIAANGITASLFIYAILRYQLLDIRVVIRQGILYSIPTIIIGATYFLIISLAINIFNIYTGAEIFILSLIVAVLSALVAEPLRLKFQSLIDRMFFREKYDSQVMLQTVSSRASSMLDLYKITKMILAEVASTLQLPRAAFFLKDEETGLFQLITQIGLDDFGNQTFRQGHPVVIWLSTHDVPLGRQEMEVIPQFQSLWKSERQFLNDMGAELFIPIKVQSKLVGIFTLGPKRSEQPYRSEEIITLSTVANQTAVAIENARLFTEEQSRRKEINTLYDLSNQLVATNDLDTVLRSVTQHAVESVQTTYSRILIREDNGDYYCRAIYPIQNLAVPLRLGKIEPIVAEHFYNTVLLNGKTVVLDINKPEWHTEEKQAIFINFAKTLCLCPLKGADDQLGILILGEFNSIESELFVPTQLRLINAIADYATSSIQRTMLHDRLEESFLQTVISLANAMDARDSYTGDHSQRMADMASRVAEEMELTTADIETLHWAGILHDIGKIGVPDGILNKKGKLTEEEWVIMKEHPLIGAQIVEPVKYLSEVSPIIRAHHEKYDGTGYPYGLSGEDIPFGSRILAVVDAYVAIRDERVYRAARSHEEAIAELRRFSGTQFDPVIVDIFCKTIIE